MRARACTRARVPSRKLRMRAHGRRCTRWHACQASIQPMLTRATIALAHARPSARALSGPLAREPSRLHQSAGSDHRGGRLHVRPGLHLQAVATSEEELERTRGRLAGSSVRAPARAHGLAMMPCMACPVPVPPSRTRTPLTHATSQPPHMYPFTTHVQYCNTQLTSSCTPFPWRFLTFLCVCVWPVCHRHARRGPRVPVGVRAGRRHQTARVFFLEGASATEAEARSYAPFPNTLHYILII